VCIAWQSKTLNSFKVEDSVFGSVMQKDRILGLELKLPYMVDASFQEVMV
jgi:hypothetical protein